MPESRITRRRHRHTMSLYIITPLISMMRRRSRTRRHALSLSSPSLARILSKRHRRSTGQSGTRPRRRRWKFMRLVAAVGRRRLRRRIVAEIPLNLHRAALKLAHGLTLCRFWNRRIGALNDTRGNV